MYADTTNEDRPSRDEIYESATNTSDLGHDAEHRKPSDVLRDMAMLAGRVGAGLRRLRSQWETAEKPARRAARSPKQFLSLGLCKTKEVAELAHLGEKSIFDAWHMREMGTLVAGLTELPAVRDDVASQAVKWGIRDAETKAAAVIRYWLDTNCPSCDGTKWELIEGTTRQGTKACRACGGTGVAQVPHGQDGRRLANFMDQCLFRHRQQSKARNKALQSIPPIDRLSKRMQPGGSDPEAD